MFRRGGAADGGITSGLRQGYAKKGSVKQNDDDLDKTPQIRNLMNLFIFLTFCGSIYLVAVYIKENIKKEIEIEQKYDVTVQQVDLDHRKIILTIVFIPLI